MKRILKAGYMVAAAGLVLAAIDARADAKLWVGGAAGDWSVAGNWSPSGVPQTGDDVTIDTAGATIALTNTAPSSGTLNSFAMSGTATLSFGNWGTQLRAATVTIGNQSVVSCSGPFADAGMSNRVNIACTDLTVVQGGTIDVDGKGYAAGNGPGKGLANGQGGGYGGQGQTSGGTAGGAPYGSAEAPAEPGSGGYTGGGAGGGAVRIEATGHVVVNGAISAKGLDTNPPGSGGGIYITCQTFAGTNGVLSADGGSPNYSSGNGGGGGGRIAIDYNPAAQAGLSVPQVTFSTSAGKRANANIEHKFRGDIGSLYLSDSTWLGTAIPHSGRLVIPGFAGWTTADLTVTGWIRFPGEGFALTVPGNVVVDGPHARLDFGSEQWTNRAAFNSHCNPTNGPTLTVGGDISLINNGHLSIHSGATNGVPLDYGALVDVAGTLSVGAYSWVIPVSHPTDGGSVLFRVGDLTVANGALATDTGFNVNGTGWPGVTAGIGYGPGADSTQRYGSGHGGLGRQPGSATPTGAIYGSEENPIAPGSGGSGGSKRGGNGGGVVRVEASGTITLNGTMKAEGWADGGFATGSTPDQSACGSGGSIYLVCKTIAGTGEINAKGGSSNSSSSGPAGGGRIAVWFRDDLSGGAIATDVSGGTNPQTPTQGLAGTGTIIWSAIDPKGTVISVR